MARRAARRDPLVDRALAPRWGQLAAGSGATYAELMHRMGHGSKRAALIYQHATNARDRSIADALSALVESGRAEAPESSNDGANQVNEDGDDGVGGHMASL